MRASDSIVLFK